MVEHIILHEYDNNAMKIVVSNLRCVSDFLSKTRHTINQSLTSYPTYLYFTYHYWHNQYFRSNSYILKQHLITVMILVYFHEFVPLSLPS